MHLQHPHTSCTGSQTHRHSSLHRFNGSRHWPMHTCASRLSKLSSHTVPHVRPSRETSSLPLVPQRWLYRVVKPYEQASRVWMYDGHTDPDEAFVELAVVGTLVGAFVGEGDGAPVPHVGVSVQLPYEDGALVL